ncbi:Beta-lactamase superfamily domain, partial [Teratosphaeria destructans]
MAVTIEKLNDDTTFLLAFAPAFAPKAKLHRHFPGAYTLLLDPWLAGSSSLLHPTFQISHHTADCAIRSLADLDPPPDLILISQDKPDHCHRDTLCALPPHTTARILAVPAAAKKIRSWRHFDPDVVEVLRPYHPASHHTVLRIPLPAYTSTSSAGEITIANIATRRDLTALHNALAITYRPPGSLLSAVAPDPAEP